MLKIRPLSRWDARDAELNECDMPMQGNRVCQLCTASCELQADCKNVSREGCSAD